MASWKEKSIGWLEKTFNVAPDGKSNIISAVYHADEPGNVHCHDVIIPIDERGRLNASRFTDGPVKLSEFHSTLAQKMEDLGLVRGIPNSHAKHKTIRKYFSKLFHLAFPNQKSMNPSGAVPTIFITALFLTAIRERQYG